MISLIIHHQYDDSARLPKESLLYSVVVYTESTSKNQEPSLADLFSLTNHQLRIHTELGPGYIAGRRPAWAAGESGFTKWNLGEECSSVVESWHGML